MGIPAFNLIADFWYSIFGNALIFTIVLIFFFVTALVMLRANISVILLIIIPLVIGIALNTAGSNILSIAPFIPLALWMIAGLVFVTFLLYLMR